MSLTDRNLHRLSFGIEEEYFLIDGATGAMPTSPPAAFIASCQCAFGEALNGEMFQSQIELVTPILHDLQAARELLTSQRRQLADIARRFDLRIICAGTHPSADWRSQRASEVGSYPQLFLDHQYVAQRSLLSGLHVHVGVPEGVDRIQVMNQLLPWLPLLLALSSSSPFWGGQDTGLKSYRQTMCGEWPRMGLPEHFTNEAAFTAYVQLLVDSAAIRRSNDIWWCLRPSARYPTLELRIADACPRVEDALCIVDLFRALVGHAVAHPQVAHDSQRQRLLTGENYWRARRYGVQAHLLDPKNGALGRIDSWLDRLAAMLNDSGLDPELMAHARQIAQQGSSADRQLAVYRQALNEGLSAHEALTRVVTHLSEDTWAG